MSSHKFSETQFSFCYVFEIIKKYNKKLVPLFPTLRQEKTLGYDAVIGGSLFLQFKIPKFMKKEKKYQISLQNNKQFEILYKLKSNKPANKVFYVAPEFHELKEMNSFYLNKTIEQNSAHFSLENFPYPLTGKSHKLKYQYCTLATTQGNIPLTNISNNPTGTYGILNSNPVSINMVHNALSDSDKRDEMRLIEKAKFLLTNVIPEVDKSEFEIDDPVDKLFSILLVKYNTVWIPIR